MSVDFSQEGVLRFLLEKGGRSSNTELMARYSPFLNDPQNKSAAREAFKGFVNTLGFVNTEDGVKYIMLKKKFRHLLEDHVAPASQERATDLQDSRENVRLPIPAPQTQEEKPGGRSSVSKQEQVTEAMVRSPVSPVPHCVQWDKDNRFEANLGDPGGLPHSPTGQSKKTAIEKNVSRIQSQIKSTLETNIRNKRGLDPGSHQDLSKRDSSKASESSEVGAEPNTFEPSNGVTSVESMSIDCGRQDDQCMTELTDVLNLKKSSGDLLSGGVMTGPSTLLQKGLWTGEPEHRKNIDKNGFSNAVGNLTKSDIDGTSVTQSSDDDVSSNHSGPRLALDPTEHEWMIRAAEGNWEALRTMLLSDPGLALRRDPLTGLTALHWAAKHGSADIIPLLLAAAEKTGHRHENGGVNMRSAGGYTPLHLAAMHESLDVAKMLVGAYEANVKSRDYGGLRPWQYLQATARWDMKDLLGAPEIEDDEEMWLDNQRQQPQSWRSRLSKAQLGGFRLRSQSAENGSDDEVDGGGGRSGAGSRHDHLQSSGGMTSVPEGVFPAWLTSQGLSARVARAVVLHLGIESYEELAACAEPPSVRCELFSAARERLPFGCYASLRRLVQMSFPGEDGPGYGSDTLVETLTALLHGLAEELGVCARRLDALVRSADMPRESQFVKSPHRMLETSLDDNVPMYGLRMEDDLSQQTVCSETPANDFGIHCGVRPEMEVKVEFEHSLEGKRCEDDGHYGPQHLEQPIIESQTTDNPYDADNTLRDEQEMEMCGVKKHSRLLGCESVHKCEDCGKTFTKKSNLNCHRRTHTGEKPFKCQDCGKGFTVLCNLVSHRRTHTGEKPYSCKECGKTFGYISTMIRHYRTHTGEKPYVCHACGRRFARPAHLHKHRCSLLQESGNAMFKQVGSTVCGQ